jgi:hypothetical protein
MGKKLKSRNNAYAEGRKAALALLARNTNPFPHSVSADRDEWFRGYDVTVNEFTRGKVKRL